MRITLVDSQKFTGTGLQNDSSTPNLTTLSVFLTVRPFFFVIAFFIRDESLHDLNLDELSKNGSNTRPTPTLVRILFNYPVVLFAKLSVVAPQLILYKT
jgi:hypothetical protein